MPADLAEFAEKARQLNAELLDGFQREPRTVRRAVSRDLARAYPLAPKPPQYGAVSRQVNGSLPPKRRPRAISEATLAVRRLAPIRNARYEPEESPDQEQPEGHTAPAQAVDLRHRMPIRLSRRNHEARLAGVQQRMVSGERVPVSGRARRDVKRQQRADFWFRRKIAADDRADAQVLADLNARMLDLSWPLPQ